eukprot:6204737-Pleurochrysis_carterae.AAC.3
MSEMHAWPDNTWLRRPYLALCPTVSLRPDAISCAGVRSFEVSSEARFCAPAHAAPPPGKSSPRALSPAGTDSFRCVGPEEASRERSARYDCPLENGRMHAAAQRQFTPHAGEEPSLLGSLLVVQGCATPLLVYS